MDDLDGGLLRGSWLWLSAAARGRQTRRAPAGDRTRAADNLDSAPRPNSMRCYREHVPFHDGAGMDELECA